MTEVQIPAELKNYDALLKHKDTSIEMRDKEIQRLNAIITENEATIKSLRTGLRKWDIDQGPTMKAEIIELNSKITILESEVQMLRAADDESRNLLSESRIEEVGKREDLMSVELELQELRLQLAESQEVARVESQKYEETSIGLDEMEERWKTALQQIEELTASNEQKDTEIGKLQEQLSLVKEDELAESKERLAELNGRVSVMSVSIQGRDDRLNSLTQHLEENKKIIRSQFEQLTEAQQKLKALEDTTLPLKNHELDRVQARLTEAEGRYKILEDRFKLAQEKLAETRSDLKQRISQVRSVLDNIKAKDQELVIVKERVAFLETQLKTERTMAKGVEERLRIAQDAWQRSVKNLDEAWSTIKDLEFQIQSTNDALESKVSEHEVISMQAENSSSLVKSKDQRLAVLHEQMKAMTAGMRSKDERLELQAAKISKLSDEEYKLKKQLQEEKQHHQQKIAELGEAQDSLADKELTIARLQAEVRAKDEQIRLLGERVETARAEVEMQMELIKVQMKQTEKTLEEKSRQADETISALVLNTTTQDEKLSSQQKNLAQQVSKLEAALKAKESLVAMLSQKLDTATETLKESSAEHSKETAKLRARIQSLETDVRRAKTDAALKAQERVLMGKELKAHREVMDEYTKKLVEAETGKSLKEEQMTQMEKLIHDLRLDMDLHTYNMNRIGAVGDSAHSEKDEQLENMKARYFQTVCLLVKTQLFQSGQMQNVLVKDLYEEVQKNKVDIEEWPSYIYSRAYTYST